MTPQAAGAVVDGNSEEVEPTEASTKVKWPLAIDPPLGYQRNCDVARVL